jgi:hypothetical protein
MHSSRSGAGISGGAGGGAARAASEGSPRRDTAAGGGLRAAQGGSAGAGLNPAAPASGGAAAPAPAAPEALVGRRVVRAFGGVDYGGVVASARTTASFGHLWRVLYDDGDDEDLDWSELRALLQPAAADAAAAAEGGELVSSAVEEESASWQVPTAGGTAVAQRKLPAARRYKGVTCCSHGSRWEAKLYGVGSNKRYKWCGAFDSEEKAARTYDAAARVHGVKTLNFPRPGTDEIQALPRSPVALRSSHAAAGACGGAAAPPRGATTGLHDAGLGPPAVLHAAASVQALPDSSTAAAAHKRVRECAPPPAKLDPPKLKSKKTPRAPRGEEAGRSALAATAPAALPRLLPGCKSRCLHIADLGEPHIRRPTDILTPRLAALARPECQLGVAFRGSAPRGLGRRLCRSRLCRSRRAPHSTPN